MLQLYSANNEFLLGFCMLMEETASVPKWLVNMHYFWSEGCPFGACRGQRSEKEGRERVGKAGRFNTKPLLSVTGWTLCECVCVVR